MKERAALGSEAGLNGKSRKGISRAKTVTQVSPFVLIQRSLVPSFGSVPLDFNSCVQPLRSS